MKIISNFYVLWILSIISAYKLWGDVRWLAIVVIVLVLSYSVFPEEQQMQNKTGEFSNRTATRLMFTAICIIGIFIYSLFI